MSKGETLDLFVHVGVDLPLAFLVFRSRSEECRFSSLSPAPCRVFVVLCILLCCHASSLCCNLRCLSHCCLSLLRQTVFWFLPPLVDLGAVLLMCWRCGGGNGCVSVRLCRQSHSFLLGLLCVLVLGSAIAPPCRTLNLLPKYFLSMQHLNKSTIGFS